MQPWLPSGVERWELIWGVRVIMTFSCWAGAGAAGAGAAGGFL